MKGGNDTRSALDSIVLTFGAESREQGVGRKNVTLLK
ncbi:hypothetical protein CY0110_08011 [Crocosphaera chwakensis CCY0110]|uniref:Uncharacterized protein n=1 Tax=Crocosphaera chwakensis CCY0110 TaxID=391612 RepID=A3IS87_9CHRO|nr:hypothetical protein CY0110_08011 [Crocosphaera chwakensis CCY0110]